MNPSKTPFKGRSLHSGQAKVTMKRKLKLCDLRNELIKINNGISWDEEQIRNSIDYKLTAQLKKEIAELKSKKTELVEEIAKHERVKALIKGRRSLKTCGPRSVNRKLRNVGLY